MDSNESGACQADRLGRSDTPRTPNP